MEKYRIEYSASRNDIEQMIALDNEGYSKKAYVGQIEKCLSWQKRCPDLYTVVKCDEKIVGYINFFPVTKKCFNNFKQGKIKDYEIKDGEILPFKKGDNYCIFISIVIGKKHRFSKAIYLLMDGLRKRIDAFREDGINVKDVVADCVSEEGVLLAENFGGQLVFQKDDVRIFEFKHLK